MSSLLLGMAIGFSAAAAVDHPIARSVHMLAFALAAVCVAMLFDKR